MRQTESLHVGYAILENTLKSLTILVIISRQHQVLEDTIRNEFFGGLANHRETSPRAPVAFSPKVPCPKEWSGRGLIVRTEEHLNT